MTDIQLVRIDQLETSFDPVPADAELPVARSSNGQTGSVAIDVLQDYLLNDPALTGNSTASKPNPGDSSNRIPTTEWVMDELAGAGLNPATSSTYGTVRTNSTDPVPVVYLKSEVDDLLDTVQPVALGGTGGTTAAEARTNLAAAKSGSNSDITDLQALASVPGIIAAALAALIPIGTILQTARSSAPSGWLICDGSAISRTTYSGLFAAIGTAYGAGDGSSTFNLPDMRGRFAMGAGTSPVSGTTRSVGQTIGAESVVLGSGNMPVHSHSGTTGIQSVDHTHTGTSSASGTHNHSVLVRQNATAFGPQGPAAANATGTIAYFPDATADAGLHQHSMTTGGVSANHNHTFTTSTAGSGTPLDVVNPATVVNYLIKV